MTTPKRVGLLGAGYICDAHASALKAIPGVTLAAVCDVVRSRAASIAKRHGIPLVFDSLEQLAQSDCDVVHVLVPPALHISAASAMIEGGKSVLLEKPMGIDSRACAALAARAAEKGVVLAVSHNFLFGSGYESLRTAIKVGSLGRLDHLSVNWQFALPSVHLGPFDNWMFAAPANLLFELGSHLAAFIVDLLGKTEVQTAVATSPVDLPGDRRVYRRWDAIAINATAAATFSISVTTGQSDRILRIRGRAGSAQVDFGRDIAWRETTFSDNPIFESYEIARSLSRQVARQARGDLGRRLFRALAKRPDVNPFEDSLCRSINAFYANEHGLDPRHDPQLAIDVIRLCEEIASAANVGTASAGAEHRQPLESPTRPGVLVVGGSGFIGRRLVRSLVKRGQVVRVLTRNPGAAALEFEGVPVELFGGSHGDPIRVQQAMEGIEVVYHLAKCEGKRWQDYVDGDVEPTRVLAEIALASGVKRFIYTGTIASYAPGNRHDIIDNRTPVDPAIAHRNHYARSKAACEALLQKLHVERGLPLVILRPGIVIGPGSPPTHPGVGRFATETRVDFWGYGNTPLPLVLVDDVADALVLALDAPSIVGQTLLLTSPPLLDARQYVEAVAQCMQARIDARPRAIWRYWLADMLKELAKNAVHHPNRRWPTLHDWRCSSNAAHYDSRMTEQALHWSPVAKQDELVKRGIVEAVDWFLR